MGLSYADACRCGIGHLHPDAPDRPSQFKGGVKGAWRMTIPGWHPTRLNVLLEAHWRRAAKLKSNDCMLIAAWAWGAGIPAATGPRRVHLAITLAPHQRADPDCFWKSLLDALVRSRLLIDDDSKNVVLDPIEFVKGTEPETTIELYDIQG